METDFIPNLEFEELIGNTFLLSIHSKPNDPVEFEKWKDNPYKHPYTAGAYDIFKKLKIKYSDRSSSINE